MPPVPPSHDAGRALIQRLEPHLPKLAEYAEIHDRDASFPFASLEMLRKIGWIAAPIPREYGGDECSLSDLVAAQTALAKVDMALAFACGMHLMSVGSERSNRSWPEQLRERIFRSVVEDGALCNQVASEPELGSPQGGGRPQTALTPDGPGRWRIQRAEIVHHARARSHLVSDLLRRRGRLRQAGSRRGASRLAGAADRGNLGCRGSPLDRLA